MSINPYAAPTPPPSYSLPAARLRRLGATSGTMAALEAWFAALDAPGRQGAADDLATAFDPALRQWVDEVNELPQASAASVMSWVEGNDDQDRAAAVALEIEHARPRPRHTLIEKLESLL